MAIDLEALKKSMQSLEEKTKSSLQSEQKQNKFFTLNMDKETKQGAAVLRFLPQKDLNALPWVEYYYHWFVGPTGERYTDVSATTFGENDVIGMFNKWLWTNGHQDRARAQARKKKFYANVYVVKGAPEQTGKVLIYSYGVKIHDLIKDCINPLPESGDEPRNPFDPFNGVNFKLKSYKQGDFVSYDKSTFDQVPTPLADSDEKIAEILEQTHDLSEFVSKDKILPKDEQIKKLDRVFGNDALWLAFKKEVGLAQPTVVVDNTATVTQPAKEEPVAEETTSSDLDGMDPEVAKILQAIGS